MRPNAVEKRVAREDLRILEPSLIGVLQPLQSIGKVTAYCADRRYFDRSVECFVPVSEILPALGKCSVPHRVGARPLAALSECPGVECPERLVKKQRPRVRRRFGEWLDECFGIRAPG